MRCVIFAAVSTTAQLGDETNPKESIPAQIADAQRLIEGRDGWQEVHEPLVVEGQSRAIDWLDQAAKEIPAFAKLLELTDGAHIDLVIVRDYDRLARTQLLLDQLRFRLRQNRVQLYSLNQPTEPLPPKDAAQQSDSAFLLESFGGILAEYENRLRVRRTAMGIRGRVKRGLHPNNHPPYGYRTEDGNLVIKPEEAEAVRLMFRLYLAGWGGVAIGRELARQGYRPPEGPRWWPRTVRLCLANPAYAGLAVYGKQLYMRTVDGHTVLRQRPEEEWLVGDGIHTPIISGEIWEQTRREQTKRQKFRVRHRKRTYPLSGLLRCGLCRALMYVVKSHPVRTYYGCGRHNIGEGCYPNTVRLEVIEAQVSELVQTLLADPAIIEEALRQTNTSNLTTLQERVATLKQQSQRLQQALWQWTRDYEDGLLARQEYYAHRNDARERLENVASQVSLLETSIEIAQDIARSQDRVRELLANPPNPQELTREELREFYHSIFGSIEVKEGEISSWSFVPA